MTVKIINKTKRNIDIWLEIMGPKYWDNDVEPDGEREHHPGLVWIHTGPNQALAAGMGVISNILPFAGVIPGLISRSIIESDSLRTSDLPQDLKAQIDAGSVIFVGGSKIQPCEWTNIYGGGDDKTFEIHGGDITYEKQSDGKYVAWLSELSISKTSG